jgi:hypothetical protein
MLQPYIADPLWMVFVTIVTMYSKSIAQERDLAGATSLQQATMQTFMSAFDDST